MGNTKAGLAQIRNMILPAAYELRDEIDKDVDCSVDQAAGVLNLKVEGGEWVPLISQAEIDDAAKSADLMNDIIERWYAFSRPLREAHQRKA